MGLVNFKPVVGYEGLYEVSETGLVNSLDRKVTDSLGRTRTVAGKALKQNVDAGGYVRVELNKDGNRSTFGVHRLVAKAFLGDMTEAGMEVMHLDHNKTNNDVNNLAWGTHTENVRASVEAGRHRNGNDYKTECPKGHKYSGVDSRGDRKCKVCAAESVAAGRARKNPTKCKDCIEEGLVNSRPIKHAGRCATHNRAVKRKRSAGTWESRILATYGISADEYFAILASQDGCCYICRRATGLRGKRLSVDHDHSSGFVRGLLCSPCNRLLGHIRDDLDTAARIRSYLERPPAFHTIGHRVAPIELVRDVKPAYTKRRTRSKR